MTEQTLPQRYLSSIETAWEDLRVEAFHEPPEFDGWITSHDPDVSLILFAGGTLRFAQRPINGTWNTVDIADGQLLFQLGNHPTREIRWKSLLAIPTRTLHIHLPQSLFYRLAVEMADYDPARISLVGGAGVQDPLLSQIGFALWHELGKIPPAGKLYAQTAAQMLAVHLLRNYVAEPVRIAEIAHGLSPLQLKRVIDFIRAHLNQDLSLASLAAQTGFSSYHFARLFRQTVGESPHQFVLRQRLETACHLLERTKMSPAQIALECGFANQSHLTRLFKQRFDLTPHAFRVLR
jgi:AraC family transcriptional regulator